MLCVNPSNLHKNNFLQMRCCRVSRQWPCKQWKKSYESLCFQQEEECITDTCQNLQAWVLGFHWEERVNCFWLDLDHLSPLRCKVNVIKHKATIWLCLSSDETFLFWSEMTPKCSRLSILESVINRFVKQEAVSEDITTLQEHMVFIH